MNSHHEPQLIGSFSPRSLSARYARKTSQLPLRRAVSVVTLMAFLLGSGALTGCAYRMGMADRKIPGGYNAVAVPVFKNGTQQTGIEVFFTNAFIRELERARVGRIADKSESQVTILGSVDNVSFIPTNTATDADLNLPAGTVLNTEYRILLKTTIRLIRNSDGRLLWTGTFDGERSYLSPRIGVAGLTGSNALYNQSARYQNIQVMASDLMAQAHDRMTGSF
jgi:TolB-like protein